MSFQDRAKQFNNAESLAAGYLEYYYKGREVSYPINPFTFLKAEGIVFTLSAFHKLEGVYIPIATADDVPTVGINCNRPITRQRYTAAHELCHHFRDADKQTTCLIKGKKNSIEKFAESFAAALLMPFAELRTQVRKRAKNGTVSFDDILEIADYFGVSFEACLFRVAYKLHAIDGDTSPEALRKRIRKYSPDKVRKSRHMTYTKLYADLLDSLQGQLAFTPTEHAKYLFQNEYIYNDSRMEGLDVTIDAASEIVTDLRLKSQNSAYCNEENEAYLSIAGHYEMYQDIFSEPVKESITIYDALILNKKLFSYYPYPEFGGQIRQNNTLVLGAKFETVDYHDIYAELAKLDAKTKEIFAKRLEMTPSEYAKNTAQIHHTFTVIHPFSEGNGRTSRAFMNVQFARAGLPPIYIKVEDKPDYIDALSRADKYGDYDMLYEIVFRMMIRSYVDLNSE